MRVGVVGAGYVGLVSGAGFAELGHDVVVADLNGDRIASLNNGEVPLYEPGLDEMLARARANGRIQFTTRTAEAVVGAAVVFVAVGTPQSANGEADLRFVMSATGSIAEAIDGPVVIAVKSTVPVGTGDAVEALVRKLRPDAEISVVSNPEFLREGAAISDFMQPDRIVVGTNDTHARSVMAELYQPLKLDGERFVGVSRRSSELIKYAANSFLAMKVTFINELADLCDKIGGDVIDVARGIGLDRRIGNSFLNAGPGFGGSCFPKDMNALARTAQSAGSPIRLVETTVSINDIRRAGLADRVADACGGLDGKTVGVLGLTFKPDTDDLRASPSIDLIASLQAKGASIRAYDPEGMKNASEVLSDVDLCKDAYECAAGADALVVVTEWKQFRALDFERLRSVMHTPVLVDLRNVFGRGEMAQTGFRYRSIGRPHENIG